MATESSKQNNKHYSTGRRRVTLVALVLVSVLLLLYSLAPHMIEKAGFKAHMLERLGAATSLRFQSDGPLQLRTLPSGQISLTGVRAASKDDAISITAGRVTSDFDILPMLLPET